MRKIVMKAVAAAAGPCEFVEAGDGVAALEALSKEEIDLILSDINMPKMDGIQLVEAIRGQTTTISAGVGDRAMSKKIANNIPIVIVTTEGALERAQEALAAGANDYLKKPFTPDQLAEKIRPFLT
jgi:two-component system chemotaxis response regulator CheY